MKFRTKDLKIYLGNKELNWKKVAEDLTLKSFETTYENGILDVDILPNRYPDASSLIGIAQEIKTLQGEVFKIKNFKPKESNRKITNFIKVINQTKETPYYFGKVILNVENKESPEWLKEFVEFYGFNSVNFLVDLANFVMIEYGAPLHIFDLDKIKGKTIIVRLSRKGEKFVSLDDKVYVLPEGAILITDKEKILGLAGIKGGKNCEVDLKTKNIFIESAVFNPEKIYQTSKKLNLKTEASYRFERKVASIRSLQALNRVSYLIQKNLGGEVLKGIIGEVKIKPRIIKFDFEKIKKFSGLDLPQKEILKILKLLKIQVLKNKLILPLDRLDLNSEEDIVEEVIRFYGWNRIKPIYEGSSKPVFIEEKIIFNEKIKEILNKLGYSEAYNYNFYGEKEKEVFKDILKDKEVEVLNPVSEYYKYFQFSLIPNLLKSIHLNQFYLKEIRLFEISKTAYWLDKKIIEEDKLGLIFACSDQEKILKEIKGIVRTLFQEMKINFEIKELENKFSFGCKIYSQNKELGYFGLIKKGILKDFDIDLKAGFIEINLEKLKEITKLEKKFVFWGLYPEVIRDLSFFIEEKMKFNKLKQEIEFLKINFIKKIELIDIYYPRNKNAKKSMTIRFIFQSQERSLIDEEVSQEIEKVKNFLLKKYKVIFR